MWILLVVVSVAAVATVLGVGIYGLMTGGAFNRKFSNKLMMLRVALQAVAIGIIMMAIMFTQT